MMTYVTVVVQFHAFLTSALDGGKLLASRPGRFSPQGDSHTGTHWMEGWVGPREGLQR
jgi:hypothetical protein